ncbi:hypothetical protein [Lachnospira multipara]|uniref:hypothetical protein n=1 Tax=Lachnospira multipara TaxID=28051 RepID=UPI00048A058A|nr:hypothetical protein [Lachnospira multipara]
MANCYNQADIYEAAYTISKKVDFKSLDLEKKAKLANAYAFAAKDLEGEFVKILKDCLCDIKSEKAIEDENIAVNEKFLSGNAFYMLSKLCDDKASEEIACNIAKSLKKAERSKEGYFLTTSNNKCLCIAFNVLSFYMNYETKNGGKEQYNDIIAQVNAIYNDLFEDTILELKNGKESSLKPLVYLAAGLVDMLEVMDQALYEIWARIRAIFKETIKAILSSAKYTLGSNKELDLMLVYAIFKGCRMNLLHTEKYECEATTLFDQILEDKESIGDAYTVAAFILAASESVKNREYQDYGREKGGVLWS